MPTASAASFSGVYVFGDSLVDPGNDLKVANLIGSVPNVSLPNGAPTPDKGYFQGRFTDGYNFADLVSNKLVGAVTQPTFPYGVSNAFLGFSVPVIGQPSGNNLSFAYGGATALPNSPPIPDLHTQTQVYSSFKPDPNAVYVISIGANDVLGLVPTGGTPVTGAQADSTLSSVASTIAQEASALVARGARHIVIADVPDVGVTPAYAGSQDEATRRSLLTQYAQTVNADIKADVNGLSVPAGSVSVFDSFAYTDAVVANPAAYGFSNITQALIKAQPGAPDPTGGGYLFFDTLHPTAQAHAQIAAEILNSIENPGQPVHWTAAAQIGAQAGGVVAQGAVDSFTAHFVAGQTYVIDGLGVSSASGTLSDPTIKVLDSTGAVVAQGDDGGLGLDTHMQFTASATGAYTIQVSGVGVTSGSFHLQVGDAAGDNLLTGGQVVGSAETVLGGAANDSIVAAGGGNYLRGGDGNDQLTGGAGFDDINGNKGDDTIVGASASGDWLLGGQGNDSITATASTGHNLLQGNIGADTLVGGMGGDTLRGGQGDDVITGGSGADWISGDLGRNTLTGGGGADIFHAGPGVDMVTDFSAAQGDRVLVDAGLTYTVNASGGDTVIDLSNGGVMTLQGVATTSLQSGWIFQA